MNPETTERHLLTIAREVIRQHGDLDRDLLSRREKERLDLARAVERVAALADDLDEDAVYVRNAFNGLEGRRRAEERWAAAARIRAALNGETNG